jgi:hypothetical protein
MRSSFIHSLVAFQTARVNSFQKLLMSVMRYLLITFFVPLIIKVDFNFLFTYFNGFFRDFKKQFTETSFIIMIS